MTNGRSAQLAHRFAPHLVGPDALERPIVVDQSNESIVVGEAVVVKWLKPPRPQPYPAVQILTHLSMVGFDAMPSFLGAHVEDDLVVAMLTAYVAGAQDGWDWYVDDMTRSLALGSTDDLIDTAWTVGALTARLHLALATPSRAIVEPRGRSSLAHEAGRGRALLDEALHLTDGVAGDRLAVRASRIRIAIGALDRGDDDAVQPIHGDLHLGQFLRAGSTIVVNDFDGNPIANPGQSFALRSPLVDVASLMQSIDHAGRIVVKRRPDLAQAVKEFLPLAIAAVHTECGAADPPSAASEETLFALRVIQELHEFVYAARSLPQWLYVPDAALAALFA